MSSDDDWEFSALEEDKRTFPELVIEVGKSYADAVLQQRSSDRNRDRDRGDREPTGVAKVKVAPSITHDVNVENPTFLRVKPSRKQDNMKRQSRGKKEEKVASILKREPPLTFDQPPEKNPLVALAEDFALSDACSALMAQMDRNSSRSRMQYTTRFSNKS